MEVLFKSNKINFNKAVLLTVLPLVVFCLITESFADIRDDIASAERGVGEAQKRVEGALRSAEDARKKVAPVNENLYALQKEKNEKLKELYKIDPSDEAKLDRIKKYIKTLSYQISELEEELKLNPDTARQKNLDVLKNQRPIQESKLSALENSINLKFKGKKAIYQELVKKYWSRD